MKILEVKLFNTKTEFKIIYTYTTDDKKYPVTDVGDVFFFDSEELALKDIELLGHESEIPKTKTDDLLVLEVEGVLGIYNRNLKCLIQLDDINFNQLALFNTSRYKEFDFNSL